MSNVIEINNLCKRYPGFDLEDVSIAVPGGTIMGLIGENGAGKSTTIKCLLGLVERDGGEVRLLGRDGGGPEAREELGVVLDECPFHDALRPREVGAVMSRLYRRWDGALFARYLDKFGLPGDKYVKSFSRGMKMKLSIAAALAHRPRLLILDEATSGLDPVVRDEILDEFLDFIQDGERGILISSHITSDLEKAADYVAYLHRGRVVVQGEKDALLERYGKLVCTRSQLDGVDRALLAGVRENQFGCEALVPDRPAFSRAYPALTVDPATLEEIMLFTVRGERG